MTRFLEGLCGSQRFGFFMVDYRSRITCRVCRRRVNMLVSSERVPYKDGFFVRKNFRCPKCLSSGWLRSRRGELGVVLLFFVLFVLVLGGVLLYIYSIPEPVPVPVVSNVSLVGGFVDSNALSDVDFVLSNGSVVVLRGVFHPGVFEEFRGVPEGSVLSLSASGRDYYFNSSLCNISLGVHCFVGLSRKASSYSLVVFDGFLAFRNVSGLVQFPLVCWAFGSGVSNVLMDLPLVPVPSRYRDLWDVCFQSEDVFFDVDVPFVVHRNPFVDGDTVLSVFVSDFERDGYSGIGVRNASRIVKFIN